MEGSTKKRGEVPLTDLYSTSKTLTLAPPKTAYQKKKKKKKVFTKKKYNTTHVAETGDASGDEEAEDEAEPEEEGIEEEGEREVYLSDRRRRG